MDVEPRIKPHVLDGKNFALFVQGTLDDSPQLSWHQIIFDDVGMSVLSFADMHGFSVRIGRLSSTSDTPTSITPEAEDVMIPRKLASAEAKGSSGPRASTPIAPSPSQPSSAAPSAAAADKSPWTGGLTRPLHVSGTRMSCGRKPDPPKMTPEGTVLHKGETYSVGDGVLFEPDFDSRFIGGSKMWVGVILSILDETQTDDGVPGLVLRNFWRWDDPKHQHMYLPPRMDTIPELDGIASQMIFIEVGSESLTSFSIVVGKCTVRHFANPADDATRAYAEESPFNFFYCKAYNDFSQSRKTISEIVYSQPREQTGLVHRNRPEKSKLNALDVFCGCGGSTQGASKFTAINVVGGIDINTEAIGSYLHNTPGTTAAIHADARVFLQRLRECGNESAFGWPKIDVVIACPPCQPFSTANRFRKKDDPRRGLVPLCADYVEATGADDFIFENVVGLSEDHRTVGKLLAKLLWMNYNIRIVNLPCENFGVPQLRRRIFIQACAGDLILPDCPVPLKTPSVKLQDAIWDLEGVIASSHNSVEKEFGSSVTKYQLPVGYTAAHVSRFARGLRAGMADAAALVYDHVHPHIAPHLIHGQASLKYSDLAKTLRATQFTDQNAVKTKHPALERLFTVREYARLQCFPDHFRFFGSLNTKYKMVGNAVPPPLMAALVRELLSTRHMLDDEDDEGPGRLKRPRSCPDGLIRAQPEGLHWPHESQGVWCLMDPNAKEEVGVHTVAGFILNGFSTMKQLAYKSRIAGFGFPRTYTVNCECYETDCQHPRTGNYHRVFVPGYLLPRSSLASEMLSAEVAVADRPVTSRRMRSGRSAGSSSEAAAFTEDDDVILIDSDLEVEEDERDDHATSDVPRGSKMLKAPETIVIDCDSGDEDVNYGDDVEGLGEADWDSASGDDSDISDFSGTDDTNESDW